ncbi:outer membrane transport energization protein TonB [Mariniphaga anaerophila]|uniref:Outer membrane transport energization protein TonB n=1 Tax=Mariniphaga anaerophila TaxID=1484053 RepID=A0A1M5FXV6_9BACT|nr:M56 family metallopeptidase [Mariniphaga anaerophila]SHF96387.1 outer membrane transport energization protein TonB [Mariniphaga anaerophila]
MESIFVFLIKASAGIILFYLVYLLFLRKETFHNANRWFLLIALISSVVLPLFPIHYLVVAEQVSSANVFTAIPDTFKHIPVISGREQAASGFSWQLAVITIYFAGIIIFVSRLLVQSFTLIHLIVKKRAKSTNGIYIVENEKYNVPFSFFNVVFINPKLHKQEDLPEILAHEQVHIRENHWFDLLIIELLTVIFWFNPFIWFFERSIKQNHEYLADKGVLAQGHNLGRYQALLINQLMGVQVIGVTNNLNFALNTNRLKMMTKTKASVIRQMKFAWVLPAVALLLFAFAEPDYRVGGQENESGSTPAEVALVSLESVKMAGVIKDEAGKPLPGTSVIIKGTSVGTVADRAGKFELSIPEESTIVLSYVGKKKVEAGYAEITSGSKKGNTYNCEYVMEDVVIEIQNNTYDGKQQLSPPPPPPPPVPATKKEVENTPPPPPPLPSPNEEKTIFFVVEDMPQFPGGYAALQKYFIEMQHKIAQSKGIKGKAKVAFTVDEKGKVTDVKVPEKDNEKAAEGAIEIVTGMPDWTPGKQRGKPVPVKYLLPLKFE